MSTKQWCVSYVENRQAFFGGGLRARRWFAAEAKADEFVTDCERMGRTEIVKRFHEHDPNELEVT